MKHQQKNIMAITALQKSITLHGADNHSEPINLNWGERYVSIALGAKLALSGITHIFKHPLTSIIKVGAGGYLLGRGITGHCELYTKLGKSTTEPVNVNIRTSFVVNKPREEVYSFWRKLDNLPLFMNHLESVEVLDEKRSHWVLKLPADVTTISWDAEIVKDEPNEMIGWSSLPDSTIDNAGKIRFQDGVEPGTTLLDVVISYEPPVGGVGFALAHVLNPVFKNMVEKDVRNFKQYMDINVGADI
ncbi:SRPBCC family protein [Mucilaginibacter ginkgonis]|uniref:DUF2892 domain-containing protein n=1 Tax=Mucilaginibacter ginkgonis TaxID=2682091 RepID=A0A7T7FDK7_9SPHI|nr:SRPBCC family protein [Mucilaginibacter ginkgonis]QQL51438.1 DUF2892 domain-containing protein [Mucilaginibacter ginkgonis]